MLEEQHLGRQKPLELIIAGQIAQTDSTDAESSVDDELDYDADYDGIPGILKEQLNFGIEGDSTLYEFYRKVKLLYENLLLANGFSFSAELECSIGYLYDDDDAPTLLTYDPLRLMDDDEDDLLSNRYSSLTLEPEEIDDIINLFEDNEPDVPDTIDDEIMDREDHTARNDYEEDSTESSDDS